MGLNVSCGILTSRSILIWVLLLKRVVPLGLDNAGISCG